MNHVWDLTTDSCSNCGLTEYLLRAFGHNVCMTQQSLFSGNCKHGIPKALWCDDCFKEIKNTQENTYTNASNCIHDWQDYLGLNESFRFCKKCDKKDYPVKK